MDTSEPDISLQDEIKALRQQLAVLRFDISGKEWLTVDEAAHYCGSRPASSGRTLLISALSLGASWASSSMRRVNCIRLFTMPATGPCVGVLAPTLHLLHRGLRGWKRLVPA